MFEGLPQNPEKDKKEIEEALGSLEDQGTEFLDVKTESISEEEIQSVFEILSGGRVYEDLKKFEDDKGILLWEVAVQKEDVKDKNVVEHIYIRGNEAGSVGEVVNPTINTTIFNEEGSPVSEHVAAEYIDGNWKLKSLNS